MGNFDSCHMESFGEPEAELGLHLVELRGGAVRDALEEVVGSGDDDAPVRLG